MNTALRTKTLMVSALRMLALPRVANAMRLVATGRGASGIVGCA